MSKGPEPKCLVPKCERNQRSRGLCEPCRQSATHAIKRGNVTEAGLIAAGLMLPKLKPGNIHGPMAIAIQALKESKS